MKISIVLICCPLLLSIQFTFCIDVSINGFKPNLPSLPELPDGIPGLPKLPDGIPGLPKLPDGIPGLPKLPDGIPGLPKLPDGIPGLPKLPDGIPGLPKLPDGIPGLPNLPDGIPGMPKTEKDLCKTEGICSNERAPPSDPHQNPSNPQYPSDKSPFQPHPQQDSYVPTDNSHTEESDPDSDAIDTDDIENSGLKYRVTLTALILSLFFKFL
uniref:Uncharacterized protein n=1 Tax=Panagrolaimus superbus TaxID=310955 RepID=A0A914Z7Q8_9BILA